MAAVDWGTLAHVQYLLRRVDINAADDDGRTALHAAAGGFHHDTQKYIEEYIEKTRLLLASGAQLEAVDHAGETPLFAAVSARNRQMVELLLAAHADFTRQNTAGETVQGVALRVRDPALLKRLCTLTASG
jgi:ankyrin repeat protein